MTLNDFIKILLGNQFNQFDFLEKANVDEFSKEITICLERRIGVPYTCIHCGQQCLFAFDTLPERRVEDIPLGEYRLFWKFTPKRIKCPYCNQVHIEKIDGLTPHSRQTDRFRLHIARRCNDSSVSAVARQYGLNDDTVRKIDKEFLSKREKITPLEICEKLGIDEIAIRKGHVYATVFYNHDTRSVIHMVQGRATIVVCDFFKEKGVEWCFHVKVVTSDLWKPYKTAVKRYLPNAKITTDKFHVFKYVGDALDQLRREEYIYQRTKTTFDIKKARFLMLKPNSQLNERGLKRIKQLKETNDNLYTGYLLKEQVFTFYQIDKRADAEEFLKGWASSCIASKLKPFVKFGKRILRHADSILEYFVHKVSNGFAEGINNKIKVIKRMAYGFHDFEYFRLKILAATGYLKALPFIN